MANYSSIAAVAIGLTTCLSGCGSDEAVPKDSRAVGPAGAGGAAGAAGGDTTTTAAAGATNTLASGGTTGATAGATGVGVGAGGTSTNSANCTDRATISTTLTGRYTVAAIPVTGQESTKTYMASTNWWHLFTDQSVTLDGLGYVVNNPSNVSVPQTDGAPIGYPTLFIGTYSGNATIGSNLPKQVSELTNVHTVLETNSLSLDTSNFNAAYDVWFTATGSPLPSTQYNPGRGGAFLMVWLFDPRDRQPRGQNRYPAHTVSGVDGTWDVWIDATNPPCISYVSTTPLNSLAFDLNDFIKDSVTNGYGVTNDMYLSVVFGGFEIWGGGDGLQLKQYCVDVR